MHVFSHFTIYVSVFKQLLYFIILFYGSQQLTISILVWIFKINFNDVFWIVIFNLSLNVFILFMFIYFVYLFLSLPCRIILIVESTVLFLLFDTALLFLLHFMYGFVMFLMYFKLFFYLNFLIIVLFNCLSYLFTFSFQIIIISIIFYLLHFVY